MVEVGRIPLEQIINTILHLCPGITKYQYFNFHSTMIHYNAIKLKQPSFIHMHTYVKPKRQVYEVIVCMYYKK